MKLAITLKELNAMTVREISLHRWLEREKKGRDIGLNRAAFDWINRHYDPWLNKYITR